MIVPTIFSKSDLQSYSILHVPDLGHCQDRPERWVQPCGACCRRSFRWPRAAGRLPLRYTSPRPRPHPLAAGRRPVLLLPPHPSERFTLVWLRGAEQNGVLGPQELPRLLPALLRRLAGGAGAAAAGLGPRLPSAQPRQLLPGRDARRGRLHRHTRDHACSRPFCRRAPRGHKCAGGGAARGSADAASAVPLTMYWREQAWYLPWLRPFSDTLCD